MSKRAQVSIELMILVLLVLLSGALFATKVANNTFEGSSLESKKSGMFYGFTAGQDVTVKDNSIVKFTTGVININPTSSVSNNEFSAVLVNKTDESQNRKYELDKNSKDLIIINADGSIEKAALSTKWQNFSATNIVLRLKREYTCIIDGEEVTLNASKFEITCPPNQDSLKFQMISGNGAGQFYLRLVDQQVTLKFTME